MQYIEGTIHDLLIFIIMIILGGLTWFIVNKILSSLITRQRITEIVSIISGLSVGVIIINEFLL
jgi:hypothetical protein